MPFFEDAAKAVLMMVFSSTVHRAHPTTTIAFDMPCRTAQYRASAAQTFKLQGWTGEGLYFFGRVYDCCNLGGISQDMVVIDAERHTAVPKCWHNVILISMSPALDSIILFESFRQTKSF